MRSNPRAKSFVVVAALAATFALGAEPEPPGIVLRIGDEEQRGELNSNEWCALVVPVRCTGFVQDAPVYPFEPIRTEPGMEMVFVLETRRIPARFSVPDYGRDTAGNRDVAPSTKAKVSAPSEPGEYEILANADFRRGYVNRGFYLVVEPAE